MQYLRILICTVLGFSAVVGLSQKDTTDKEKTILEYLSQEPEVDFESPEMPGAFKEVYAGDSTSKALYYESLSRYFEYRLFGYQHREKVFAWQLLSSKIIFFCVIILLMVGLYFSYLQFKKSMLEVGTRNEKVDGEKTETDKTTSSSQTTIEATLKGFKISSPVLGVIILAISLIFFYLYLIHIYPIREIF